MSDELKNKFRDYEASASDEHIEARWQAIRPLLPAEGRRKAVILPLFTRRRMMVAFLVLSAVFITLYLAPDRQSSFDGISVTKAPHPSTPAVLNAPNISRKSTGGGEPSPTPAPAPSSAAADPLNSSASLRLKTRAVKPTAPTLSQTGASAVTAPVKVNDDETLTAADDAIENARTNASLPDSSTVTIENLTGIQWKPDSVAHEARTEHPAEVRFIKASLGGRNTLEAYAGVTRYMHRVKYAQRTGHGFVAGITHHTKLKGRFFLPLQVSVTGPQQISESELTEVVPLPPPATTGLTTTASGNQQYEKLVHTDRMAASIGFQAALGFGYRMMAWRHFTVSVMGMAEVSTYEFRTTRVTTREDGSTTIQQPAPAKTAVFALAQTSSPAPPSRQVTYALVPGIHLSYKLAPRWTLTGRCAWHYSPRDSKSIAPEFYVPSRRNLDFCAGLGFRW
jgi:hypothetical protein